MWVPTTKAGSDRGLGTARRRSWRVDVALPRGTPAGAPATWVLGCCSAPNADRLHLRSRVVHGVGVGVDGGEGLVDRVVEVVAVERVEQAVLVDEVLEPARAARRTRGGRPAAFSSMSSRSSMSAAVTSMSVIASHWSTTQRGWWWRTRWRICWRNMPALAKNSGASHRYTRRRAAATAVGWLRDAVPALVAVDPAEHLAVRPPAALEEQQDRQHDGDEDAFQHAEEHDAGGGHEREHQRRRGALGRSGAARRGRASDSAAAITTAASAVCGRSASRELKNSSSRATTTRADEPGELALGARLLGDGGPRPAGRHGEALEEPGRDVGRARCRSSPGSGRPRRRGGRRSSSTWRSCR